MSFPFCAWTVLSFSCLQVQEDPVAARVDGETILWKDVDRRIKPRPSEITPERRRRTLQELVVERLVAREASRHGVMVGEKELEESLEKEIKRYRSEEEFDKSLRLVNKTRSEHREEWRRWFLEAKLTGYLLALF